MNNDVSFPRVSKSISDYFYEEEGNISREKVLFIGSLLIIVGVMLKPSSVFAAHSSHSSHASHASHASSSTAPDSNPVAPATTDDSTSAPVTPAHSSAPVTPAHSSAPAAPAQVIEKPQSNIPTPDPD